MSEKVLFGAEADQIQSTLFRVSRQREVIGGSRLLEAFGDEVERLAVKEFGVSPDDVLVSSGGNFRIQFPIGQKGRIAEFEQRIADAYHMLLDAAITMAEPQVVGDATDGFKLSNEAVGQSIRRRKQAERGTLTSPHVPTIAYCQSSGVGLATVHEFDYRASIDPDKQRPEDKKYLSHFAQAMGQSGMSARDEQADLFLGKIKELLPDAAKWTWPKEVDDIAAYDGERKNVAYLIADANNMGELFGHCQTPQELKQLSDDLDAAMRWAVAMAAELLAAKWNRKKDGVLPALPLILAGDDAFVLLPAKYVLDFAQRFCLAFEAAMNQSSTVKTLHQRDGVATVTMAAAVVICKGHYPYHLAHERGEQALAEVKRLIKTVGAAQNGGWHSALGCATIVGSELVAAHESPGGFRPSLGAYWATSDRVGENGELEGGKPPLSKAAQQAALPLAQLLAQRLCLRDLPAKRLAELRELYTPEALPKDEEDMRQHWDPRLNDIRNRIAATQGPSGQLAALDKALQALGQATNDKKPGYWWRLDRANKSYLAHGLLDLLEVWDYSQSLDHELDAYEGAA